MQRNVSVLILVIALLAAAGFAGDDTQSTTGPVFGTGTPSAASSSPVVAVPMSVPGNAGPVIRWDKFYDRQGNLLAGDPGDIVGRDSLFFKDYGTTDSLYGCPKSEVPDPTPASCRAGFTFLDASSRVGSGPLCDYIYEVSGTSLRRHNIDDGSYTSYTISNGSSCCKTDGNYLYVPVGSTVYKYTLTGGLVNQTTLNITPLQYVFSVVRDTVWCGTSDSMLNGYACAKFEGGSITEDATWNLGTNTGSGVAVCWDGAYYYATWNGHASNSFKRFNPNRTLSASGTIDMGPFGIMCKATYDRAVTQDSIYWKSSINSTNLLSSPKARTADPAQPSLMAWQYNQALVGMTPDGHYIFEAYRRNLRRTDLYTGAVNNYPLTDSSGGTCATDGEYVYVPFGTTTRKYTLTGSLVSSTTTNYAPWLGNCYYGFGVANDTVWLTPSSAGTTWYGYACPKFTEGSITHDATWTTSGGSSSAMTVNYDGRYYYMTWAGTTSDTLLRFYRDRTLYSTGTVTGSPRGLMCKAVRPLMIVTTDLQTYRTELAETLRVASGGALDAIGTHSIGANATFPATAWYNDGCRVILEFSGSPRPTDPSLVGESLAKFVDLGGRVVTAMWADHTGNLAGRYVDRYMPFTMQTQAHVGDSMGMIHDPLHPIMDGVTALKVANYVTGNTHSTLRSPNCICLAEWTVSNRAVAAYLDSAGVRLASVGFVPFRDHSQATGQWARLLANAILWVWPGMPGIGVTAPATGNVWYVGQSHDITWTAVNGPILKDSIVYSYDNGRTWNFLDKYNGSRTSYTWNPIPDSPDTNCYVKVFAWNATGQARGLSGKFEIRAPVHDVGVMSIIQPADTVDSGTVLVPTAVVKNFGNIQETFPVRFNIGGSYTQDTSVALDPGVVDTVTLLQWVAGPVGTHVVRCSTMLATDEYNANDRALGVVTVAPEGGVAETNILPLAFALYQPCPNPLASGTQIRYALPHATRVELLVYDVTGTLVRRLVEGAEAAGYRRAYWNGRDERGRGVAPGVYYCRFRADDFLATQKLVVRE